MTTRQYATRVAAVEERERRAKARITASYRSLDRIAEKADKMHDSLDGDTTAIPVAVSPEEDDSLVVEIQQVQRRARTASK